MRKPETAREQWKHDAEADAIECEIAGLIDELPTSKIKLKDAWRRLQQLGEHPSHER